MRAHEAAVLFLATDAPDHEVEALRSGLEDTPLVRYTPPVALGPLALTGFLAGGEIGPVGSRTFVHTYTTTIGLLREAAS